MRWVRNWLYKKGNAKAMRIGIIGHFGGNEKFNDGQTVKTIAIYDALKRYGLEDVDGLMKNMLCFLNAVIPPHRFILC